MRLDLIAGLAKASGVAGMVGGQIFDLLSPQMELDAGSLTHLQQLKTGALIRFSVEAGAILGFADTDKRHALIAYAHDIGLAFQIADDLLDVLETSEVLGKTAGKDAASGKVTFVSLLGVERAEAQANMLVEQAIQHISIFGKEAETLREAARFVIHRQN